MTTRSAGFFAIAAFTTLLAADGAFAQVKFVELADGTMVAARNMTVDGMRKLHVLGPGDRKIGEV